MARYVVHLKGRGDQALSGARFLSDGFSWRALTFGPFWLLAQGAWIAALGVLVAQLVFSFGLFALGLEPFLISLSLGLFNLLVALESAVILGWELRLKGYDQVAVVSGDDRDVLEERFFSNFHAEETRSSVLASLPGPAGARTVLGLFPTPPQGNLGSGGRGS
ncbi:Protein of unknown function DUF2628 [Rhabdaerophilaceae bacterium]